MIAEKEFSQWQEWSRRDDWHQLFVGSDIRVMLGEIGRLRTSLGGILDAYESGAVQMASEEIGDPDNGIPMHPWHEEWLHHARAALKR